MAAAAGGGREGVRKAGWQAKWSLPHGHIAFRVEKEKRGGGGGGDGQLERRRRGRQSFPLLFLPSFSLSGFF